MFPLLCLPKPVVKKVFRSMDHQELFFISVMSKRIKKVIRSSIAKNSVYISFEISYELRITVGKFVIATPQRALSRNNRPLYKVGQESFCLIPDLEVGFWMKPERNMHIFNTNFKMDMIQHCMETFNDPIVNACCGVGTGEFVIDLLRYFKEISAKIKQIVISDELTEQAHLELRSVCSDAPNLIMGSKGSTGSRWFWPFK